jgi:Tfp pilus assembly PilM family ATPase
MAPRGDIVNGIEIRKEHISIAQFSPVAHAVVNASLIISPGDEGGSAAGVSDISALKPNVRKLIAGMQADGQDAVVSLPSDFAVVKKIMLDRNEANVRETVEWELSQQVIGSMDDYVFDFDPCGNDGADVKWSIAAAYKNTGVQKVVGLLKASKLVPVAVDLDMFALINVFEANYPDMVPSFALIVHGRDDATNIIVTAKGTFVDCEIALHGSGLSSPSSYADMLRETIAQGFSALEPQIASAPLFCTGSAFSRQDFAESVFSSLGNARLLNPFATVQSKIEIPEADLQKCLPYLSVAVGLAIRGAE